MGNEKTKRRLDAEMQIGLAVVEVVVAPIRKRAELIERLAQNQDGLFDNIDKLRAGTITRKEADANARQAKTELRQIRKQLGKLPSY